MNLDLVVSEVLILYAQKICDRVRDKWDSSMRPGISGNKEIHADDLMVLKGIIMVKLIASGQAAWELEYGKGSKMAKTLDENPYLQEYLHSDLWNPRRTGYSIRGREAGTYSDLDGNTADSTGKLAGFNLETDGKPEYQPVYPQYIINYEVKFALPEIAEALSAAIANAIADDIEFMLGATKITV